MYEENDLVEIKIRTETLDIHPYRNKKPVADTSSYGAL